MTNDAVYFLGAIAAFLVILYMGSFLLNKHERKKKENEERQTKEREMQYQREKKTRDEEEQRELGKMPRRERAERKQYDKWQKKQKQNLHSKQSGKRKNRHPNAIVHSLLPKLDSDDHEVRHDALNQLLHSKVDLTPALIDVFRDRTNSFSYQQRFHVATVLLERGGSEFVSAMVDVFRETEIELNRLLESEEVNKRRHLEKLHSDMMMFTEESLRTPPMADVVQQCRDFGVSISDMLSELGHNMENDIDHLVYEGDGNVEDFYADLSTRCIEDHGTLSRVDFITHFPNFTIKFTYSDEWSITTEQRRGQYDIHFMSFGYVGEGPRYIHHFLEAAGFFVNANLVENLQAEDALELRGCRVVLIRAGEIVSEHEGLARFVLEESNEGSTFKVHSASSVALAQAFLAQNKITEDNVYLIVRTPVDYYGIDCNGKMDKPYELFNAFASKL